MDGVATQNASKSLAFPSESSGNAAPTQDPSRRSSHVRASPVAGFASSGPSCEEGVVSTSKASVLSPRVFLFQNLFSPDGQHDYMDRCPTEHHRKIHPSSGPFSMASSTPSAVDVSGSFLPNYKAIHISKNHQISPNTNDGKATTGEYTAISLGTNPLMSSKDTRPFCTQLGRQKKTRGSTNCYRVRFTTKRIKTSVAFGTGHSTDLGAISREQSAPPSKKRRMQDGKKLRKGLRFVAYPAPAPNHVQTSQMRGTNLGGRQVVPSIATEDGTAHCTSGSEGIISLLTTKPPPTQYLATLEPRETPRRHLTASSCRDRNFLTLADLDRRMTRFANRLTERLAEIRNS
ncbi:hypothetical protein CVT26_004733 [Gymnopilus dilepis]|uniref:Uncharacterized protein n=1 Tax=Gymnopilus dilepis TaxID=231916 RepID=A0A409WJJ6_9AGAR|nr:hypothetical protein CVT26_004733 [Gymnopilus dilepis]